MNNWYWQRDILDFDAESTVSLEYIIGMKESVERYLTNLKADIAHAQSQKDKASVEREMQLIYGSHNVSGADGLDHLKLALRARLRLLRRRREMLELHEENPEWFLSYPEDFVANDGLFKLIPGYPENPHYPPPKLHQKRKDEARKHWRMLIQWTRQFMRRRRRSRQLWDMVLQPILEPIRITQTFLREQQEQQEQQRQFQQMHE